MAKYRKKPVVIEARQLHPDNWAEIVMWCNEGLHPAHQATAWRGWDNGITIRTLEGDHFATYGDYIIKGVKGEFYPCKPDIFEMTYEVAE
jgi:thioesterase domain-containing protein